MFVGIASPAFAAIVTYDASTGLLPQATGWTYNVTGPGSPPTVSVGGGILTLDSPVNSRGFWEMNPVPATPGTNGVFMEATVRVVSESHTVSGRGATLPHVGHGDGVTGSGVDLYAWTDRIFVNDGNDVTVATYLMDTTDAFHNYRVELLLSQFKVFVDGTLVLSGTTPTVPTPINAIQGRFGDASILSGGITEWTLVRVGAIPAPEPASIALFSFGGVGLLLARRRRKTA